MEKFGGLANARVSCANVPPGLVQSGPEATPPRLPARSKGHTDADLRRPVEVVTDMSKTRKPGFTSYQATDDAFFDLFEHLRAERLVP